MYVGKLRLFLFENVIKIIEIDSFYLIMNFVGWVQLCYFEKIRVF